MRLKAFEDDDTTPRGISLRDAIQNHSDIRRDPGAMMERLLTVLHERNVLDVADINAIVASPYLRLVPEDYDGSGDYKGPGPR